MCQSHELSGLNQHYLPLIVSPLSNVSYITLSKGASDHVMQNNNTYSFKKIYIISITYKNIKMDFETAFKTFLRIILGQYTNSSN